MEKLITKPAVLFWIFLGLVDRMQHTIGNKVCNIYPYFSKTLSTNDLVDYSLLIRCLLLPYFPARVSVVKRSLN
jgi:hypothetical protein